MKHYPNKDDWNEKFWKNNYRVLLTAQGIEFLVNANHEQDALDFIIDYCRQEGNLPGLIAEDYELSDVETRKFICGGNRGLYLTINNIYIEVV